MTLNKELLNQIITVTSSAAISCYRYIGKNEKEKADKAATDSMRKEINKIKINGEVVIGEGELDEAPMLYIGEKLGAGGMLNLDIAVDVIKRCHQLKERLRVDDRVYTDCQGRFPAAVGLARCALPVPVPTSSDAPTTSP